MMLATSTIALPRLTVAAYVISAKVATPIREASADARMRHVQVDVHVGGIDAAIKSLSAPGRRFNAIYIEVPGPADTVVEEVGRLASAITTEAMLTIIGHVDGAALYRRLIEKGVLSYLVAPLDTDTATAPFDADSFIGSLSSFVDTGFEAAGGATVAVYGTRGGAGATTIASNLAWLLSANGDTCLVDLVMPFGAVAWTVGVEPPENASILYSPAKIDATSLDSLLVQKSSRLNVLVPHRGTKFKEQNEDYATLIKLLRARHDAVVLDLPKAWAEWTAVALCAATEVVLVVTPDFAGVSNAQDILKHIRHNRTQSARPPVVVLNQVAAPHRAELRVEEVASALGLTKSDLVILRYDPKVFSAGEQAGKAVSMNRAHAATRSLQQLVDTFTSSAAPGGKAPAAKPASLITSAVGRLIRRPAAKGA